MECKLFVFSLLFAILLAACTRTKPQMPSNQPEADTVGIALLQMNQRLAEQSDSELAHYVLQSGEAFVLNEFGFWLRYKKRTQHALIMKNQKVKVHYQLSLLDGTMCADIEQTVQVGKKQLPSVMELSLQQLRLGENVVLLAPWYLAFGQQGTDYVPPYASVRIEMEVSAEIVM